MRSREWWGAAEVCDGDGLSGKCWLCGGGGVVVVVVVVVVAAAVLLLAAGGRRGRGRR